MISTEVGQAVTLAIALLGAALGLFNAWRAFSQDRVKLRVRPSMVLLNNGAATMAVDVVNLSSFPLTVTHVGFTMKGSIRHLQLMAPMLVEGGQLPKRLEPRTSLTALVSPNAFQQEGFDTIHRAYAKTACGLQILSRAKDVTIAMHNLALATAPQRR